LQALIVALESLPEPLTAKAVEPVFQSVMTEWGVKLGDLAQPVRVALTGGTVSPGIFEVISVLGKERTLRRLKSAMERIAAMDSAVVS
jgi:glutamyl-tRNA synthetase